MGTLSWKRRGEAMSMTKIIDQDCITGTATGFFAPVWRATSAQHAEQVAAAEQAFMDSMKGITQTFALEKPRGDDSKSSDQAGIGDVASGVAEEVEAYLADQPQAGLARLAALPDDAFFRSGEGLDVMHAAAAIQDVIIYGWNTANRLIMTGHATSTGNRTLERSSSAT
jgi:hypothetical protein